MATSTITKYMQPVRISVSGTSEILNISQNSQHFLILTSGAIGRTGLFLIACDSSGNVGIAEIYKGTGITSISASAKNELTVVHTNGGIVYTDIVLLGQSISLQS